MTDRKLSELTEKTTLVLGDYGYVLDSEVSTDKSKKATYSNILALRTNQDVKTTSSPTFAGLTVDTNTLYVDSANNRVGIGTTSPGHKTQIDSNGSTNSILQLNGNDARGAGRYVLHLTDNDSNGRGTVFIDTNVNATALNIDSEATSANGIFLEMDNANDNLDLVRVDHQTANKAFTITRNTDVTTQTTFSIGGYHLWVDSTGDLRIKAGEPTSDTDGTIVGTQS